MAREHGGDLFDLSHMTDEDIRELVVQQLREYPNVDADWIDVQVKDGFVTLSGRVGTDSEVQVAEAILHDVIGVETFANELVVDELHRMESPEAIDDWLAEEEEMNDQLSGGAEPQQSDTAQHLVEDLESAAFGTHDIGEAIQDGIPYVPPDRPIGDGYTSRENH
ncbi:MAG: BON domain-containing protein [Gemmatimonadetes bacterium]|nr:BON domain-containing protein [Gemmatimonadota bacterium]